MLHKTMMVISGVILSCFLFSITGSDTWKKDLLFDVLYVAVFLIIILIWRDSYRNCRERKKEDETEEQAQHKQDNNN